MYASPFLTRLSFYCTGIGVRLRQDDPTALKEIVQLVQTKVAGQDRSAQSSRTRFMLETLTNLKNNKLGLVDPKRKVGQANGQMLAEAVERMKKFVNGIGKKRTGEEGPFAFLASFLILSAF